MPATVLDALEEVLLSQKLLCLDWKTVIDFQKSLTVSWGVLHTLCLITWVGGKKELKTADDFAFEGGDEDLPTSLGKRSAHKAFITNNKKSIEILLLWVVSLLLSIELTL